MMITFSCGTQVEMLKANANIVDLLTQILRNGTSESKAESLKLIQGLGSGNIEYSVKLANTEGLIPQVVDMLRENPMIGDKAARTLWFLCMIDQVLPILAAQEKIIANLFFQVQVCLPFFSLDHSLVVQS
jgi:hypothetical protein